MKKRIVTYLALFYLCGASALAQEVPYGNQVSSKIFKYHRHTPYIATSGTVQREALVELKSLGFKSIVDLRMPEEGTEDEKKAAEKAGLIYYNIPVKSDWPTKKALQRFKRLVTDKENYPMLIHCATGNRIGRLWTYYRISEGVNSEHALIEGRTIALTPSQADNQTTR